VLQAALAWDALAARAAPAEMMALLALTFATLAGLVLLVSRGRSRSAKWVLVILCAIGLPLLLLSLERGTLIGSTPVALVQAGLQVGSLGLLFAPDARKWLAGEG
jgi:hypothetical protein